MTTRGRRRGPAGGGSVYQETRTRTRADGTTLTTTRWVGAVTLPDGKRKRVTAATEKAALTALRKLQGEIDAGKPVNLDRQTVAQYLAWWLETITVKPTTQRTYEAHIRVNIVPQLGRIQLTKLTPEDVEAMMATLRKRGLSVARVKGSRDVLMHALNVALRRRRVTYNAAYLAEPPRAEEPREVEALTPEECQQWIAALQGHRLGPSFLLAMGCGLRQGEILGLRWQDVDLDRGRLEVRQQVVYVKDAGGKLAPQIQTPKTRAARRQIIIPGFVVEALRQQQITQQAQRDLATTWDDHDLIFATGRGHLLNPNNFRTSYYKAERAAGLPHRRFHDLRHIYQSLLVHLGVHPYVAMDLLGHAGQAVNRHYTHVLESAKVDVADRLDALLQATPGLIAHPNAHPTATASVNER